MSGFPHKQLKELEHKENRIFVLMLYLRDLFQVSMLVLQCANVPFDLNLKYVFH